MAKKAKLDILEIAVNESEEDLLKNNETIANDGGDEYIDKISDGGYLSRASEWLRKPIFWIIFITFILLSSAAFIRFDYFQSMENKDVGSPQYQRSVSPPPLHDVKAEAYIGGMVVDQKDLNGNPRLVFCDIALDLENCETSQTVKGDRADVRGVIYSVLHKELAEEGLSPEGRGRLKERVKSEINRLLREDLVKDVYFTSYELK